MSRADRSLYARVACVILDDSNRRPSGLSACRQFSVLPFRQRPGPTPDCSPGLV